jgi:trimethylamine--corrinoid protein Co-methyltransferase
MTYSFAQLAICDQIVDWIKAFLGEIEVTNETLALDEIEAIGPGGNYLATKHTKKHFRETWYPDLFERGTYPDWQKKGSKSLIERASERVEKILVEHHPEALPGAIQTRLRQVLERV